MISESEYKEHTSEMVSLPTQITDEENKSFSEDDYITDTKADSFCVIVAANSKSGDQMAQKFLALTYPTEIMLVDGRNVHVEMFDPIQDSQLLVRALEKALYNKKTKEHIIFVLMGGDGSMCIMLD